MAKTDALQGSLDLLVLKILSRRPRLHGYAIMAAIAAFQLSVLAGTILLMLSLIGSAFMTVFILVWTALMLLVVDAGRNLRSINRKTGKT